MSQLSKADIPLGITVRDEEVFLRKMRYFAENNATDVHTVLDFDRTLTYTHPEATGVTTSWQMLQAHLPTAGQQRQDALFNQYYPLEIAGTMSQEDASAWWSSVLSLFAEYQLDLAEVERDFMSRASIRPGTRELFTACGQLAMPTVIISAAVKDIIDMWSAQYGLKPDVVVSTKLTVNEDHKITGWEASSLVHGLNKHEVDHPELVKIREQRPKSILVGDSERDADMAFGDENVIRVRIFDTQPGKQIHMRQFRQDTFREFDALIEGKTLLPLVKLVETIARH